MAPEDRYFGLRSPPRTEVMTLSRLVLEEIPSGRLRIPEFHRALRWRPEENVRLFDSVMRGLPIGSLHLWPHEGRDGDLAVPGAAQRVLPARSDAWFVVDGLQRLAALAGAMLGGGAGDGDYKLCLNFETWSLASARGPALGRERCIPVSTLVDAVAYRAWARKSAVDETTLGRLDELAARIRDFTVPVVFLDATDQTLPGETFTRLNAAGAPLTADEIDNALAGGPHPAPGQLDLARLRGIAESRGFGSLDPGALRGLVLGAAGLDPWRPKGARSKQDVDLLPRQDQVEASLHHLLDFLVGPAGVAHVRLLPDPQILPVLARFFHVHPQPDPVDRDALTRWFWRVTETGAPGAGGHGAVRAAIRAIGPDEHDALRALMGQVPRPDRAVGEPGLAPFDPRFSRSRVEVLVLLSHGPRDLPTSLGPEGELTGGPLSLGSVLGAPRLAEPVLGASRLSGLSPRGRALAATAANRILLGGARRGLVRQLCALDPERHSEVSRSHLLSPEALGALKRGDHEHFLRVRARDVADAVHGWLAARTRWELPYIAPLATYLRQPEAKPDATP